MIAWLVFYVGTLPLAWFWIDCIKDWSAALAALKAGQLPLHGTNVIGAGSNGPLLFWLYQLVLWMAPHEWALPALSTMLGAISVAWIAVHRRHDPDMPWLLLFLCSFSMAFEMSRIGSDPAFFPITVPLLLLAWGRHEKQPLSATWAAALGFVCALGTQLYVAYLPVAVAVGLELKRSLIRVVRRGTAPTDAALVFLSFCVALLLPFVHTLASGALRPAPLSYGTLSEFATTAWHLFSAFPRHMSLRAGIVAPWLQAPLLVVGWAAMLTPLAAPLLSKPLPRSQWLALWTFISGILLTSYPDRVHYHHFGHLAVSYFAAHIMLASLLLRLKQRVILGAATATQMAFLLAVALHAHRTGFVIYGDIFPTVLPGQVDRMPTLQARRGVYAALRKLGADHPFTRQRRVHGDREFPFWANGWARLGEVERFEPLRSLRSFLLVAPHDTAATDADILLYACTHPEADDIPVRPRLCLRPQTQARPVTVHYQEASRVVRQNWNDAVLTTGARAEAFFMHALSAPLVIETQNATQVVIRGLRPSRIVAEWTEPMWTLQPPLAEVAAQFNYPMAEHVYALPPGTDRVTLQSRSVVLDVELR